jgi:hypothetical protein
MRRFLLSISLSVLAIIPAAAQQQETVTLTGQATTARIADPSEKVVFNGRVMRMADFVAAVSSSNAMVQHLRNQEMRNREKGSPTPLLHPTDSKSPSPCSAAAAGSPAGEGAGKLPCEVAPSNSPNPESIPPR